MYDHRKTEPNWQQRWQEKALFLHTEHQSARQGVDAVPNARALSPIADQEKMYLLFAFAYPSGAGLHVGHVESKTALDILARYYRMNNKQVFFPVGWDAFGLPAENFAIKTGIPPAVTTKNAIDTFRRQIQRIGISYDWANEIATSHPGYYQWTQWLFVQLFNKGLAYRGNGMVNWCPSCQTVLANEQVVNGECERCGTKVVQKQMEQWFFKITKYQDELISGLDEVDWPYATKQQQLNWIGKSEGASISFPVIINGQKSTEKLTVFSTAHDTIYGCTFMVIAPEHSFITDHQQAIDNWKEVSAYIEEAKKKTELDRQILKDKTGVKVEGIELINPLTGKAVPLFVADYVLAGYGTGSIMAVPAHDERDYEFAKKYDLPIIYVTGDESSFISYSDIKQNRDKFVLKNSQEFDGLNFADGRAAILEKLRALQMGERQVQYKLRDWLISRQRYWGAPIPIVYDPEGQPHPVVDEALPWALPTDVDFNPTGESPLKSSAEFQERTEQYAAKYLADLIKEKGWDSQGKGWRPEYDTMDTFVDSSWYYLRYTDARNTSVFAAKQQLAKWMPVDFYMIGPEHIVLHLLYSRFFTKFLRDEGYLTCSEPFSKMRHQGMILGPDGKKMSKSKGNTINPDEIIESYGADTLRVYEMFMGPIDADKPWSTTAVAGVYRFLQRLHGVFVEQLQDLKSTNKDSRFTHFTRTEDRLDQVVDFPDQHSAQLDQATNRPSQSSLQATGPVVKKLHQTLQKVTQDIPELKFNTSIASMMEFVNVWEEARRKSTVDGNGGALLTASDLSIVARMIAPFAPFLAEELWMQLPEHFRSTVAGAPNWHTEGEQSVHQLAWPVVNLELAKPDAIQLPIQINGKIRAKITVAYDQVDDHRQVVDQVLNHPDVKKYTQDTTVVKQLYIAGRIFSIVTKT